MLRKKRFVIILIILIIFAGFLVINNSMLTTGTPNDTRLKLLAHRGLAQTFNVEEVKWDTNTAAIIYEPEHDFLENTLPSIRAAVEYGADIIEFDIKLSADKDLVLFHDFLLEYRTEKTGAVSDYTMKELKQMDAGYGYTYDGGQTFPFRGKGIGLIPSFEEVIDEFPQQKFLIHIKDGGAEIGYVLLEKFRSMNKDIAGLYSLCGNDEAIGIIREEYPEIKAFTAGMLKEAFIHYELIGWSGYIPQSIRNMELHIPLEYAKFLWGWPEKFIMRMDRVNSRVVLVQKKGPWTDGFNSPDELDDIPDNYYGYIMTDRIDKTGERK